MSQFRALGETTATVKEPSSEMPVSTRFSAYLQADPIRQFLSRCNGLVVGADEALHLYDEHLIRTWRADEALLELTALGDRARDLLGGPRGDRRAG